MVLSVLVGGRHVSLDEVTLVTTSTEVRPYAQVVLDGTLLETIEKGVTGAKKAENITAASDSPEAPKLTLSQVRAAIFCRIVHAMQGRSGVRPALIQVLVDLLNADVQSFTLPANDNIGDSFIGFFNGSNISSALADELSSKNIPSPKFELSTDEVAAFRQNSSTLALIGSAAGFFASCAAANGSVDAVAALTCAAVGVPAELKDDTGLEFRPHRSIATAAGNIKAFLRESADAPNAPAELADIPQQHGPAIDCLATSVKSMATELNSYEKSNSAVPLGPAPTVTMLRSALNAVIALEQASRKRLCMTRKGIRPWSPPAINAFSLPNWELVATCTNQINSLQNALIAETDSAMAAIQSSMAQASAKVAEAGHQGGEVSAEVKARMEAVAEKERQLKAKMTPDELAKYEKKKAEKEAKAAAKAAAKKDKAGGAGGLKSVGFKLSPGIEAVVNLFKG